MNDVDVLAVDVGASTIKYASFAHDGEQLSSRVRRPTPYPMTPHRLVDTVARRVVLVQPHHVGLGFPGEIRNGRVIDAANLARRAGAGSDVDPDLVAAWRDFDLRGALHVATGRRVVVLNDAAMAALGCAKGDGRELTITLGTGCGLALILDGQLVATRDIGDVALWGSATYDDVLGEGARAIDIDRWQSHVVGVVADLAAQHEAKIVHLAGGNARRLSPRLFDDANVMVVIERGDPGLVGCWYACQSTTSLPVL